MADGFEEADQSPDFKDPPRQPAGHPTYKMENPRLAQLGSLTR